MRPYSVSEVLLHVIPKDEQLYFIVEDSQIEKVKFWLYEGYINEFCRLLDELYYFEYYVVSRKMLWLVCENHHQYLITTNI